MRLQVLLLEDDPGYLTHFKRDLPRVFTNAGLEVDLHPYDDFELATKAANDPSRRFDLIVSDTYKGDHANHDAAVLAMVTTYRDARRFCPLVVFSSAGKPDELQEGPFVVWADKAKPGDDVGRAITEVLATGIPQLARSMHDELDGTAGEYLWHFLEDRWDALKEKLADSRTLDRLIRRRAATQLAEVDSGGDGATPISEIEGLEYYIYPPLSQIPHRLGEVIQKTDDSSDIRVILTPHCHLVVQPNQPGPPRAAHVLTVRTRLAEDVLGAKLQNAKGSPEPAMHKKLRTWATPPSGDSVGLPDGRFWFLPAFLDIPHCFCDFQMVDVVAYDELQREYKPVAVLASPLGESLQACFSRYYASIGLPNIRPGSIEDLLT